MARKLSPEEKELWQTVAKDVSRLEPRHLSVDGAATKVSSAVAKIGAKVSDGSRSAASAAMTNLSPDLVGSRAVVRSPAPNPAKPERIIMDRKTFSKMRSGKLSPDARIDLHGLTVDQAQLRLTAFIKAAHARGDRLLLVITGKGRGRDDEGPIPRRQGVLRHHVPLWCRQAPLGALVLQLTPAHRRHGGEGAFYVYLRRSSR